MMRNASFWFMLWFVLILSAWACQPQEPDIEAPSPPPQPTVAASLTPSATPSALPTPTGQPSPTFPPTLTPTLTATPAPPSETPLPTPTPGPFEHRIRQGDDCIGIVYQYGHTSLDVLQVFYEMNGLASCVLPAPGNTVLVPRPTVIVEAPVQDSGPTPTLFITLPAGQAFVAFSQYCTTEDDTLTSIALKNNTTLRRICELNPLPDGLDCRGCDFSQSDVGFCPNPPLIKVGQCLTVPGPTPSPSWTPQPSGLETATPTPTLRPPALVYPAEGMTVRGALRLQWVSVGLLGPEEYYVVNLLDESNNRVFIQATRDTSLDVPLEYAPQGTPQSMVWSVSVQVRDAAGLYQPLSAASPAYRFTWE